MVILIILVVLVIYFAFVYFGATPKKPSVITFYSGTLGSGKTLNAVSDVLRHYHKQQLMALWQKIIRVPKEKRVVPCVYSSIPLVLKFKHKKPVQWSYVLTSDIITLKTRLPEGASVLIDEFGSIASQYDWDKELVKENLREFIRFYRHYVNGFIACSDQASGEIAVPMRRRLNYAFNCDITKFWPFKFFWVFYRTYFTEVTFIEEVVTIKEPDDPDQKMQYFVKFHNPFNRQKNYDSRCYSERYTAPFVPPETWKRYKTNDLLEIPVTAKDIELYKKYR